MWRPGCRGSGNTDGAAFRYASEEQRADFETVLGAVKANPAALSCVSEPLRQRYPGLRTVAEAGAGLRGLGAARCDEVFEGKVGEEEGSVCVVSFPGAYLKYWDQLVQRANAGRCGTACVFLPESDPKQRFGRHAFPPGSTQCWCQDIYGEKKAWGCLWFEAWLANVAKAVAKRQRLVVVHFPYENRRGLVPWGQLRSTGAELWNKEGLGGSQKGEAAYLLQHFPGLVEHVDLLELHRHLPGFDAIAAEVGTSSVWELRPGGKVVVLRGALKGRRGTLMANWDVRLDDTGEEKRLNCEDLAALQ